MRQIRKTGTGRPPWLNPDRIDVITENSAPAFGLLKEEGFVVTDLLNNHPSFGTSGRVVYFHNFHLALHWIEDRSAFAKSMPSLYNNKRGMVPQMTIGVAMYGTGFVDSAPPFAAHCREQMDSGGCLKAAGQENESAPSYFIIPQPFAFTEKMMERMLLMPLMHHNNSIQRLSRLTVFFEGRDLSRTEKYLKRLGIIEYRAGPRNYVELEFDNNRRRKEIDLRNNLSITIKY